MIWLQTPTVFWLGGGIISISYCLNGGGGNNVRQTEIHTTEPLVPKPSAFQFEIATEKIKRHKSPGTDQILVQLTKAGGRKIRSEIYNLINP